MLPGRWHDVEDDIRRLWRHAPLTAEKIQRHTRYLVPLLSGDGDPALVQDRLERFVLQSAHLEEVGALAAVLGMLPGIDSPTVPGRLGDYAMHHMPGRNDAEDTSTPRRRAERGAQIIAQRMFYALMPDDRNRVEVRVWGTIVATKCSVTFENYRDADPWNVQIESRNWAKWADVPYSSWTEIPSMVQKSENLNATEPGDDAWKVNDFSVLESEHSLLDSNGSASLRIYLFESPQPYVDLIVAVDYPCQVFSYSKNYIFEFAIEVPREQWASLLILDRN